MNNSGNLGFIISLGLLGFPAVIPTIVGQVRVLQSIRGVPFPIKIRIVLAFIVLFATAIGVYAYVFIFITELYFQLTCSGGRCSQGGMGVMIYTPLAWISYAITSSAAKSLFNGKQLPLLAKPNFSFTI